jgi:riboflavin synthase
MFTGLIEKTGVVESLDAGRGGARLTVAADFPAGSMAAGDSIAVSGACLTVTVHSEGRFSADVSPETLKVTTIGGLKKGDAVNLERALSPSGRLGGHFVLGHVDGMCRVVSRAQAGEYMKIAFSAPGGVAKYLVPKGSIAIDGVSLTVNDVRGGEFSVIIIPHTLDKTTLGGLRAGSSVNVECDILGKYVASFLGRCEGGGVSMKTLEKAGFLG